MSNISPKALALQAISDSRYGLMITVPEVTLDKIKPNEKWNEFHDEEDGV